MLFELGLFPDEIESRFSPKQWAQVKLEYAQRQTRLAQTKALLP